MNEEEIKVITDSLSQKYVLISRTKFLTFLGGFFAFLVAAGFLSYQAVLNAINSTGVKTTIAQINQFHDQAESGVKKIDELLESFSKPPSLFYAQSTETHVVTSDGFEDIPGLYLQLPPGNAIRKFALVALNVPSPYATGKNYPGAEFRIINAGGKAFASGFFTYESKDLGGMSGRRPFTLIVRIPLISDKQTEIKAQWRSVRGSSCTIDSFSSISAILE